MGRRGIEIDGQKLRNVLLRKGLSSSEISKELGHCSHYIANIYTSNMISKTAMQHIEKKYGIYQKDIAKGQLKDDQNERLDCPIPNISNIEIERIIDLLVAIDNRLDDIQHSGSGKKQFIIEEV